MIRYNTIEYFYGVCILVVAAAQSAAFGRCCWIRSSVLLTHQMSPRSQPCVSVRLKTDRQTDRQTTAVLLLSTVVDWQVMSTSLMRWRLRIVCRTAS